MARVQEISLRRPDDWHLHVRDGQTMATVVPYTARQFARAIIMPNLILKMGRALGMDREGLKLLSAQEAYGRSGSKKAALSLGIREARGEVILTTDADCLVAEGWVRGIVECFDGQTGMVVGFSQIGAPGQAQGARMGYQAVDFLCLMGCILGSVGRGSCTG